MGLSSLFSKLRLGLEFARAVSGTPSAENIAMQPSFSELFPPGIEIVNDTSNSVGNVTGLKYLKIDSQIEAVSSAVGDTIAPPSVTIESSIVYLNQAAEIARKSGFGGPELDAFFEIAQDTLKNFKIYWTPAEQEELLIHFEALKKNERLSLEEKRHLAIKIISYKIIYEGQEEVFYENQKKYEELCKSLDMDPELHAFGMQKFEPIEMNKEQVVVVISTTHSVNNSSAEIKKVTKDQKLNALLKSILRDKHDFYLGGEEGFYYKELTFDSSLLLRVPYDSTFFLDGKNSDIYYMIQFEKKSGLRWGTFGIENDEELYSKSVDAAMLYMTFWNAGDYLSFPYESKDLFKTDIEKVLSRFSLIYSDRLLVQRVLTRWLGSISVAPTAIEFQDFVGICYQKLMVTVCDRNNNIISNIKDLLKNTRSGKLEIQVGNLHERDLVKKLTKGGYTVYLFESY